MESSTSEIIMSFWYGLRFDVSAIIYINFIFILLLIIPNPLRDLKLYQLLSKLIYYISNLSAFIFSIIDIEYFKYTKKRTTYDVFGMSGDWLQLLPQYLKDYWYLALLLISFILLVWITSRNKVISLSKTNYLIQFPMCLIIGAISIVGARGGFQLKPLKISDAAINVSPENIPLVLNTPFTILRTYGRKGLTEVNFMPDDEARRLVPIYHKNQKGKNFNKINVVIIIVESLSKEFIGALNSFPGYTPFLDSIAREGMLCTNGFANGTRSMEAVPAILASIPNLMDDSYIYSVYQGNNINSIGSLLRDRGYQTSFFHGGTNGTMGFDSFIKLAGIEHYYGRTEYNSEKDYDGFWGIPDEEFLQFTAQKLNETVSPFCATIFTLSSHHPYSMPPKHKDDFQGGSLPIHRTIMYTDYSLGKFFATASKMSWYNNTLFVITGDHTPAETEHPFYRTMVGLYSLPIIFFQPNSNLHGRFNSTAEQIDIMPSILDYIHYDGDYIAFGKSIFDTTSNHFSTNFINGFYQIVDNNYVLQYSINNQSRLFDYYKDSAMTTDITKSNPEVALRLETRLKAVIQDYNYALVHNTMTLNTNKIFLEN